MDKKSIIEEFLKTRPEVVGAYGYGSGVLKQSSYGKDDKPQIDLILIVENLKKWHRDNIGMNPMDYSNKGRRRLSKVSRDEMKGPNHITYCSRVKDNDMFFKFGIIEANDFINDLYTWDKFYVAGRFQKPMLSVVSNSDLNRAILKDRMAAFLIACILSEPVTTYYDLFYTLCNLSYIGDFRMGIAENPNKVANIVVGSFNELFGIYSGMTFVKPYKNEQVQIDYDQVMQALEILPDDILFYLADNDDRELSASKRMLLIRKNMIQYFKEKNKGESISQAINGYKNNGLGKSIPYVASKISKKLKRK